MIWRFPKKYAYLTPSLPGSVSDRMVSFVDLAPTMLSLTGIDIPEYMQGEAFLGEQQSEARNYVHLFRGRMDERIDLVRAVRDRQYRYIKNYMPHRIYGQYIEYLWRAPSCKSWEAAYKSGLCNEAQSVFWEEKPAEELYDVRADPWEVNNLADDPAYADVLIRMRTENDRWMSETKDSGLMPEGFMSELNKKESTFDYVRSEKYDFAKIKHAADVSTMRNPDNLAEIITFIQDEDPLIRYWGATGCLILGESSEPAVANLKNLLSDSVPDVRITAAEALYNLGYRSTAVPVLIGALDVDNEMVRVHALGSLDILGGEAAKSAVPRVRQLISDGREAGYNSNYDIRAAERILEIYGG
jgi:hypothetical protein